MHHVPTTSYRKLILEALIAKTKPGGYLAVSFWQFMQSDTLAAATVATHEKAITDLELTDLDSNDYILGWNNIEGAYRYCHNFTDAEIDELITAFSDIARPVARYNADGRTNLLNCYVVLEKH
jgi:hypothetical protein